jgi:hypothetical protein
MSWRVAVLALVVCVVLAGCGGPGAENETTTGSNANGTRVVAVPPNETVVEPGTSQATLTTTAETTRPADTETTVTYNQDVGYEARLSNANETAKNVTVSVVSENGSTTVFEESVRLSPDESLTYNFTFPHVGAYAVSVEIGDETVTRQWEVAVQDPDHGLNVYVSRDGEVHVGFVAI